MPKNMFQRPAPVKRDTRVSRHGAPVPAPAKGKPQAGTPAGPTLPPLEQLLKSEK